MPHFCADLNCILALLQIFGKLLCSIGLWAEIPQEAYSKTLTHTGWYPLCGISVWNSIGMLIFTEVLAVLEFPMARSSVTVLRLSLASSVDQALFLNSRTEGHNTLSLDA